MADFARAAATAKRLVEANGRAVDLVKLNRDPDDPAKPWRGTSSPAALIDSGLTISGVKMAFVPATGSGFGKLINDGAGSLALAYDQIGLLASTSLPAGSTPEDVEQADQVVDGDDVWKIVSRGHLKPSTTSVLFVLALAR